MEEISLVPHVLLNIGDFAFNQAVLATIIVTTILFILGIIFKASVTLVPNKVQVVIEQIYIFFYDQSSSILGENSKSRLLTAYVFSLFLFILISNQFSLIPFIQNILFNDTRSVIPPTSHLSQTLALALITVVLSHVLALMISPVKHIDNLFNFSSIFTIRSIKDIPGSLLSIFLLILNIVGEFAKVISLACRLFGNIFAGEVMVAVIAGLSIFTTYFVPIPFIMISIFSGVIQAFVFAILSMSFITGNIKSVS